MEGIFKNLDDFLGYCKRGLGIHLKTEEIAKNSIDTPYDSRLITKHKIIYDGGKEIGSFINTSFYEKGNGKLISESGEFSLKEE